MRLLHYWLNLFIFFLEFNGLYWNPNSLCKWHLYEVRTHTCIHNKLLTYITSSMLMVVVLFFLPFKRLLINAEDIAIKLLIYGHTKVLFFPFFIFSLMFNFDGKDNSKRDKHCCCWFIIISPVPKVGIDKFYFNISFFLSFRYF